MAGVPATGSSPSGRFGLLHIENPVQIGSSVPLAALTSVEFCDFIAAISVGQIERTLSLIYLREQESSRVIVSTHLLMHASLLCLEAEALEPSLLSVTVLPSEGVAEPFDSVPIASPPDREV